MIGILSKAKIKVMEFIKKKKEIKVMDDMFGKKKKTRRCLIGLSILRK